MAVGAESLNFDDFGFGNEAVRAQGLLHSARESGAFHLGRGLAAPAD